MRILQCSAVVAVGVLVGLSGCSADSSHSAGNGLEIVENVTYRPETVVVPADKAKAAILERADDDSSLLLDGSSPELAGLSAGRVLVLGGVTLRKVTNVVMEGNNLRVTTDEAALTDAIEEGELHWKGKLDWNGITTMQTNLPGSGINPQGEQPWKSNEGASGSMGPWKYSFTGSTSDDKLTIKAKIESTKPANAWVEISAEIDRPDVQGDITIHQHVTENAEFATRTLKAKVSATWSAGISESSAASLNDILFLPVDLPIPILGGVPLFFRVGANFAFIAGLVGRGTSAGGHFEWTMGGSSDLGGAASGDPSASGESTSQGTIGDGTSFDATGGSALSIVLNVPRFGISLGVPKTTELIYSIGGIIALEARASGPLGGIVPCKEFDLTVKASHSIEGKLLGISVWKASQELGTAYTTTWSSPMGFKCGK